MLITAVGKNLGLFGAAKPHYYTEAALYLLTPSLQTGDLALLSQIAQLTPAALLAGLLILIWRGELVPRGTVEREREQSQARLNDTIKSYETRLADRDLQMEQKDKQIVTLLEAVKEGTLLVSQAAALVSQKGP